MKNTHGGELLLVNSQALACNITKSNTPPWMFPRFLNCAYGTKSRKASHKKLTRQIIQYIIFVDT